MPRGVLSAIDAGSNLRIANRGGILSMAGDTNQSYRNKRAAVVRFADLGLNAMTQEEIVILDYLKGRPGSAFAKREIARKAFKRTVYEQNPHWVDAPLASLVSQQLAQIDDNGNYHVPKNDPLG